MKKKKGISLIVLIITIIVVIILAVTVILTLTKNNPIESAKEAVFKEDVRAFQDELNMYISKEYTNLQGQRDIKITALGYDKDGEKDSVYTYIPDFKKKYEGKLAIKDDMIAYVGSDAKEKEWLLNSGVYIAKTLTVKYVDQDGNKLKEDESIALMDNYYSVDVPEIEGYIRFSEKLEGKISQDIEVIAEYYLENDNLAFMGLDASGKETTDEASIVSYEVTGIGECNVSKIAIPREHNGKPVTKIKANAFNGDRTLKSIIVGDNIENIGGTAFQGSSIMTASINASTSGNYIFMNARSLEKVVIGKDVKKLNAGMFIHCNKLSDLTILTEEAEVNNYVLNTTVNLKEIKVNKDNSKYMVEDGILFSKDRSKIYAYPTGKVGDTYKIPSNVKEIGDNAFSDCPYLKKINIPDTIESVGNSAFGFCSNLKEATVNAKNLRRLTFYKSSNLESVTIGSNVSSWGDQIFLGCNKLSDLTILSSTLDVNNNHLYTSSYLKEIKVNEDNNKYMVKDGILFSKDGSKIYAYPTGKQEDTYVFDSNVKEIGESAFWMTNLKCINIPDTIESVGNSAFGFCSNLKEVTVNAKKLRRLTFYKSSNLESVTIGANVSSWSDQVFLSCNKIPSITYLGTKDEWSNTLGKTSLWKSGNTSIKKIICSDGEINM